MAAPEPFKPRQKNIFVLCFDGTGNKFSGTETDSNILKLYRMLDRSDASMYTFYQPGIGTYITSHSMQTTSAAGRIRSWYLKAKDSAIGSSFAEHVMGGYEYLMKYYSCEDDLYFFGFSRGAYTARFLAEMLDHIGLLSAGNEELMRFAWKTYAKWAARSGDGTSKSQRDEASHYDFMRGFRETFCRPVRRIRFLGLFDTVNSVPRFESAWMKRSSFPYTARSTAKVIRHAVSIDERRAKFRQDLVSGSQPNKEDVMPDSESRYGGSGDPVGKLADLHHEHTTGLEGDMAQMTASPTVQPKTKSSAKVSTAPYPPKPASERASPNPLPRYLRRKYSDSSRPQDIKEVWFAGGHADIGGGWERAAGEKWPLSHAPLVWMLHEAETAGLKFDALKMAMFSCIPEQVDDYGQRTEHDETRNSFVQAMEHSYSTGVIHDCLQKGAGLPSRTVTFWRMIEYLPFRRMDLQPDGSWKAIRWPLPMGEPCDIPSDALIHYSVIERMRNDPEYRPGNLIVGGGGRGVRKAPDKFGIGEWVLREWPGDLIKQTFVRKVAPPNAINS